MIAVQVVMIISRVHSVNLFNFLNGIYGDIEMICWNESYLARNSKGLSNT